MSEEICCKSLGTVVPEQLAEEITHARTRLREALGGDVAAYVADRLQMTPMELAQALATEQIEGVALALYNIEARGEAVIIGDQTGIGKGRQAAAIIRYGINAGYFPIFLTDRYTLFSDMYRDCKAVGIPNARPLIVNPRVAIVDFDMPVYDDMSAKADEVWSSEEDSDDEDVAEIYSVHYQEVYKSPKRAAMNKMYADGDIPEGLYDYMMLTYSQLKDAKADRTRLEFLTALCQRHRVLFVFDEAHRSSSVSDGKVSVITRSINSLLEASPHTRCVFLSATFAKRPENLITFMQQTMLNSLATSDTLQKAFANGGVPMQEYVAARLAKEGQMIRREHSGMGIPDPIYTYLDDHLERHAAQFNRVMHWFRQMVSLSDMVKEYLATAKDMDVEVFRPYSTRQQLFYINKILLLSLKASDVAETAVREVQAGRSVVIGMSDTLECVLRDTIDPLSGECRRGDFSTILLRLLQKTLNSPRDPLMSVFSLDLSALSAPQVLLEKLDEIRDFADEIEHGIKAAEFNLPMSPIDVIRQLVTRQSFTDCHGITRKIRFEECTGRARQMEYESPRGDDGYVNAIVIQRQKRHTSHIYNDFQNNELDVILVNATGAIGASAHAVATARVPEEEVRQRKMLIVQNDLDVNIDLQKRGRINRTGQLAHLPPLYEYVITAIPSEKRLNMMLRAKLRSLSANTTANQDQEQSQADFLDITNKYGNLVTQEYIKDNPQLAAMLDVKKNATASQFLARIAILDVGRQQEVIDELLTAYQNLEDELRRLNQWDLEREHRDFEAEYESEELFSSPIDNAALGGASMLTTFRCRHRTFPYDAATLRKLVAQACEPYGNMPTISQKFQDDVNAYYQGKRDAAYQKNTELKSKLRDDVAMMIVQFGPDIITARVLIKEYSSTFKPLQRKITSQLNKGDNKKEIIRLLNEYREESYKLDDRMYRELDNLYAQHRRLNTLMAHTVIGQGFYDISRYVPTNRHFPRICAVLREVRLGKTPDDRFAPTKVKFVFALSAGPKELILNITSKGAYSNFDRVNQILYSSHWRFEPKEWNKEIAKYNNQLLSRKIITGNILGAFAHPLIAEMQPRFITFTLAPDSDGNKAIERGLLLPMSGNNLDKVTAEVTLPLADGLKYANSRYHIYPIAGTGVDFTISPQKSAKDPGLWYYVSITEKDSSNFELDRRFDPIRGLFRREKRNKAIRYTSDLLLYNSSEFLAIMSLLASFRAMIVIPRTHLTVGEIKLLSGSARKSVDNSNWPALDWRNDLPLTPKSTAPEPVSVALPEALDESVDYVDEYPPGIELCRRTLNLHGCPFGDKGVIKSLRTLYFEWGALAKTTRHNFDIEWALTSQDVAKDIQRVLEQAATAARVEFSGFSCRTMLRYVEKVRLSPVGEIMQRFKAEMQLLSPPKEEAQAFLDGCLCDPKLDKIRQSLEAYISGQTPIIK